MKKKYAIALHGGAGVIPKTIDEKTKNDLPTSYMTTMVLTFN